MAHLVDRLIKFRDARNWKQFHTPRNLMTALTAEAGEALEIFRWKSDDTLTEQEKEKLKGELADIYVFLLYLTEVLGLDLETITEEKMNLNDERYSVEKSKDNSKKYTEL